MGAAGSDVSKLLESDDLADPTTENIVTLEARPQAQPPGAAAEESERPCPGIWTSRRTIGVLRDYVAWVKTALQRFQSGLHDALAVIQER